MALPKKHRLKFFNKPVNRRSSLGNQRRFAFVVGTKISKKAVERNKIKRRLLQCVQELLPKIKPGDYVIYAKKEMLDKEKEDLKNELEKFFNNTDS